MLDGKVNLPKNDNANYLWIQYFYNYLKPQTGRAGFVMASSASDAGHSEKDIREKLVKTGAVDVMMAIGNNFFYTRSLPCTLWFFDRAKTVRASLVGAHNTNDKVLMLDARKIYRKVTSKVNDFSPEQLQNLICIVNLYRGNTKKFESTVKSYLQMSADLAKETAEVSTELQKQLQKVLKTVRDFATKYAKENKEAQAFVDALNIEESASILSNKQNELIETKPMKNHIQFRTALPTSCKKRLRKPQDKLIKQLLDAIKHRRQSIPTEQKQRLERIGCKRTTRPTESPATATQRQPR